MSANDIIGLMGVLYLIFGLGFIFNKKYYSKALKDLSKSTPFMFLAGMLAFVLGYAILIFFNEFTLSREGLVTFVGIASLIKWITIFLFPNNFWNFSKTFTNKKYYDLMCFWVTAIWILLCFLAFFL